MDEIPLGILWALLAGLLVLSGFFSSSETGLLSINPYRLRHWERSGRPGAGRVARLLSRKDRLLGLILVCNNVVNLSASVVATFLGLRLYGDLGVVAATALLAMVIVVFAEVAPKTLAALHPERVAFPASFVLRPLIVVFQPLLWLLNQLVAMLLRPFGVDPAVVVDMRPDIEELRSIVHQSGHHLSDSQRGLLLNVLALENVRVESIMTPRADIVGIDLNASPAEIAQRIAELPGSCALVYRGDPHHVVGALSLRLTHQFFRDGALDKAQLARHVQRDVAFIPPGVSLYRQLAHFNEHGQLLAVVVDEHGATEGVVSRESLTDDIIGTFQSAARAPLVIDRLRDDWVAVDGVASLRDLNKAMGWELPIAAGATTLNGLLLERLGVFPDAAAGVRVDDYLVVASVLGRHGVARAEVRRAPMAHAEET